MGEKGLHIGEGSWTKNNPVAEEVYAHITLPLTKFASHELIQTVYGKAPHIPIFPTVLMADAWGPLAAQRYPDLFYGIVKGCPVLNLCINGSAFGAWVLQAMSDEDEAWVENDEAPDIIEVTKYYENSDRIERKGKLRPYQLKAKYRSLHP